MLIWKGWGILAIICPLICALLIEFCVDSLFGSGFYQAASWPLPLAFMLSAIPVLFFGQKLNKKPGRIVIDPENNEKLVLKETHSLFWVPLQYWSIALCGLSVWIYLANIGLIYQ
ncbi:MAG: hypothetical protein RBR22_04270 [Desulfuromonas sp.]|nr:hypothetical protein [Desulfuromonas sp.]